MRGKLSYFCVEWIGVFKQKTTSGAIFPLAVDSILKLSGLTAVPFSPPLPELPVLPVSPYNQYDGSVKR